jgi:hypothetical protein
LLAPEALRALTGEDVPESQLQDLEDSLRTRSGSPPERVYALEPDFLGELFVLERLLSLGRPRETERAGALMSFAWRQDSGPQDFIVRLVSDFVARAQQVAEALPGRVTAGRVNAILESLVLSALGPDAQARGALALLPYCAYLSSKAGQWSMGYRFVNAIEEEYRLAPAKVSEVLAEAWFGFALSDVPGNNEYAGPAMQRLSDLFLRHGKPEIALTLAKALMNASVKAQGAAESERLADRIGEIREQQDTAEIALTQAMALMNASVKAQGRRNVSGWRSGSGKFGNSRIRRRSRWSRRRC